MMKKAVRFSWMLIRRSLLGIFIVVGLYFLAAWICSLIPVNEKTGDQEGLMEIRIHSNGVHTDIVLPVVSDSIDWRSVFPLSDFEKPDSSFGYIAFGWGDKGFYLETPTWADLKVSTAFKAAFFLSTTAMHVTYWKRFPQKDEECKSVFITKEQYGKLIRGILSSFEKNNQGKPIRIDHEGYNEYDCFYDARGTYSFLRTCNTWTGRQLREAGIRAACWTPFDWGVFSQLEAR